MPLYVGLDCSTQGLSAIVLEIDERERRIVLEQSVDFDRDLPHHGTVHGVLHPGGDPRVAAAPPLMWAEALDRMMAGVARALGGDAARIQALSGSAQQHGSVYLKSPVLRPQSSVGPAHARQPLVDQVRALFSRDVSPIWMDSSTSRQCAEITAALGGASAVGALTGSRCFERFTAAQIRKFWQEDPEAYARTSRIHLVSSFMASLLTGEDAALEPGDASGMNLMDIRARSWAPAALDATAPRLEARLPRIAPSSSIVGPLDAYWIERHGFPHASVVAWSGDNPCSLVGVGLVREGRIAISLGTSDTVFGAMDEPRIDPSGTGHVFGAPTGHYMGLTCFSNGSLARERVRDAHGLSWDRFSDLLRRTPAGNNGRVMLPWFEPEITPAVLTPGVRRYGFDPSDAAADVRAVVEAQAIGMKRHSGWMGVRVDTIHATGGGAANREILQVLADVFGAEVRQLAIGNSAALGAALRAYHGATAARGHAEDWDDVIRGFVEPVARVQPTPEHRAAYDQLARIHAAREQEALSGTSPRQS